MLGMYAEFSLAILSDYSYVIIHFSFQQRTTNDLDMRRRTPSYTWHQKDILENGNLCIFVACGSRVAFTQILMGHHTLPKYKTNASSFLIANGVVHFNLLIRILCKLSKTCINCYKCSLAILIIPEIAALGIGIGLLIDFNSWRHALIQKKITSIVILGFFIQHMDLILGIS